MISFHNSTHETGKDLELFKVKALTQEDRVYEIFRRHVDLTPSECHAKYPDMMVPLTSIRRAITNLTKIEFHHWFNENDQTWHSDVIKSKKLTKTDVKRVGPFGRPEYVYKAIERL